MKKKQKQEDKNKEKEGGGLSGLIRIQIRIMRGEQPVKRQQPKSCETRARLSLSSRPKRVHVAI